MKAYYCYKIEFSDGSCYFGSRACDCKPVDDEQYNGSPGVAIKAKWLTHLYSKTVLACFDNATDARTAERKLIRSGWKLFGSLCLNTAVTTIRKGKFVVVDRHGYIIK
jgi:hypothetical protein